MRRKTACVSPDTVPGAANWCRGTLPARAMHSPLIDAEASALMPPSAPVVVLAIGATKAAVDAACAVAAAAVGASAGIPVSPPPALVPNVAIMPPG